MNSNTGLFQINIIKIMPYINTCIFHLLLGDPNLLQKKKELKEPDQSRAFKNTTKLFCIKFTKLRDTLLHPVFSFFRHFEFLYLSLQTYFKKAFFPSIQIGFNKNLAF